MVEAHLMVFGLVPHGLHCVQPLEEARAALRNCCRLRQWGKSVDVSRRLRSTELPPRHRPSGRGRCSGVEPAASVVGLERLRPGEATAVFDIAAKTKRVRSWSLRRRVIDPRVDGGRGVELEDLATEGGQSRSGSAQVRCHGPSRAKPFRRWSARRVGPGRCRVTSVARGGQSG